MLRENRRPGIYEVNRSTCFLDIQKRCGWVYLHRSSYYYDNICVSCYFYSRLEHRHGLTKPNNMGSKLGSFRTQISRFKVFLPFNDLGLIYTTAYLQQFPMKVEYIFTTGPFMKIVNILGYNMNLIFFFQSYNGVMCSIRFHLQ